VADLKADSEFQSIATYEDVNELYELCGCRKEQTKRVCRSHEVLRIERAVWEATSDQHLRNEMFYRDILVQCARHLMPAVFISDDGSVQDSPLMLKIPELVSALKKRVAELEGAL